MILRHFKFSDFASRWKTLIAKKTLKSCWFHKWRPSICFVLFCWFQHFKPSHSHFRAQQWSASSQWSVQNIEFHQLKPSARDTHPPTRHRLGGGGEGTWKPNREGGEPKGVGEGGWEGRRGKFYRSISVRSQLTLSWLKTHECLTRANLQFLPTLSVTSYTARHRWTRRPGSVCFFFFSSGKSPPLLPHIHSHWTSKCLCGRGGEGEEINFWGVEDEEEIPQDGSAD